MNFTDLDADLSTGWVADASTERRTFTATQLCELLGVPVLPADWLVKFRQWAESRSGDRYDAQVIPSYRGDLAITIERAWRSRMNFDWILSGQGGLQWRTSESGEREEAVIDLTSFLSNSGFDDQRDHSSSDTFTHWASRQAGHYAMADYRHPNRREPAYANQRWILLSRDS